MERVGSGVEFHFSLRSTRDWKSESVTNGWTYGLTWVGARDTCVSKKIKTDTTDKTGQTDRKKIKKVQH